ncbi:hypothetical protein LIER_05399 [Lithospermum erythrorhizon]|uniref:Integrase zinc-binding domain-containing protein n=1 Tax=Lithospermum erythrorhizon TaxID=34254 RepID=A0AAV3P205_LITER
MAVEEMNGGMYGSHINGKALTQKIQQSEIFWPSVDRDTQDHLRRCDSCQRHNNIPHQPPHEMVIMLCPVPFHQWGMDIVRDLPRTPGGKGYTIVAVDYFTKGVEAKPYPAGSGSGVPVFNGDLHPVWGIPSAGRR